MGTSSNLQLSWPLVYSNSRLLRIWPSKRYNYMWENSDYQLFPCSYLCPNASWEAYMAMFSWRSPEQCIFLNEKTLLHQVYVHARMCKVKFTYWYGENKGTESDFEMVTARPLHCMNWSRQLSFFVLTSCHPKKSACTNPQSYLWGCIKAAIRSWIILPHTFTQSPPTPF